MTSQPPPTTAIQAGNLNIPGPIQCRLRADLGGAFRYTRPSQLTARSRRSLHGIVLHSIVARMRLHHIAPGLLTEEMLCTQDDHGWTPMHYIVRSKQLHLVPRELINEKTLSIKNNKGHIPLWYDNFARQWLEVPPGVWKPEWLRMRIARRTFFDVFLLCYSSYVEEHIREFRPRVGAKFMAHFLGSGLG